MRASIARLRVRSVRFLRTFVWRTFPSQPRVVRAPGFFGGRLLIDSGLTPWTLTVWESEDTHARIPRHRGTAAHARVLSRWAECRHAAARPTGSKLDVDAPME